MMQAQIPKNPTTRTALGFDFDPACPNRFVRPSRSPNRTEFAGFWVLSLNIQNPLSAGAGVTWRSFGVRFVV